MIFKRFAANLRAQNWFAIGIEIGIVIIGVFVGTQVSNWNAQRIEKRETAQLLLELKPALQSFIDFFDSARVYYATTHAYSDRAFAGWRRDPTVSDEQFVIAAYQASQIYVFGLNGENWAAVFGSDRLRDIDDIDVRRRLSTLMTTNYSQIEVDAVATRYREEVRRVIPEDLQDIIRAQCGDRPNAVGLDLPKSCDLDIAAEKLAAAAAMLRARPDLVGELRWHRAAVATFLSNLEAIDNQTKGLKDAIDKATD